MKTTNLFFIAVLALAIGFTSCSDDNEPNLHQTITYTINFEDVRLDDIGYSNGSDLSGEAIIENSYGSDVTNYYGGFTSSVATFLNVYTEEWYAWSGFACSNHTDMETAGIGNEFSVYSSSGAENSTQFAVAFDNNATFVCPQNENGYYTIKSMMLTNSTYAYLAMKNGDAFTKIFNADDEDWFKVTITGFKGDDKTKSVDYYLADFRNGKSFIANNWAKVDVSLLGEVDKVKFSFDSSDKLGTWMNNPAYVCVDNIVLVQTNEKK